MQTGCRYVGVSCQGARRSILQQNLWPSGILGADLPAFEVAESQKGMYGEYPAVRKHSGVYDFELAVESLNIKPTKLRAAAAEV